MLQYLDKLAGQIHRLTYRLLPRTLISFLLVGTAGVAVHMLVLNSALHFASREFVHANAAAMMTAATFNYLLNNKATFHARTLTGKRIVIGYLIYLLVTSLGLAASLAISTAAFHRGAVPMAAALCGIVAGALWNYVMSYTLVWKLLSRVCQGEIQKSG